MQILRRGVVMPAALAAAILAASCSSSPTPPLDIALTGIAATAPVPSPAPAQQPALTDNSPATSKTTMQITPPPSGPVMALATPAGGVVTPQTNPAAFAAPVTPAPTAVPATGTQVADTASAPDKPLDPASARVAQAAAAPVPTPQPAAKTAETSKAAEPVATASSKAPDTTVASAAPAVANDANSQPRGFLASLFSQNASATPAAAKAARDEIKPVRVASVAAPVEKTAAARQRVSITPATKTELSALPGVNAENLFEIKRRSGGNDVSDVDANEEAAPPVRVASVTGLARLAPNGLAVQTDNVDVACLKPQLVRVLKNIESHYRSKVVVTSGYRSPSHNKRARGAKNSLHMYCAAADIQIAGVSKWQLASYLRTMPGRGGVGTYCHTESVHVDIGPERDWNWRCRRSR